MSESLFEAVDPAPNAHRGAYLIKARCEFGFVAEPRPNLKHTTSGSDARRCGYVRIFRHAQENIDGAGRPVSEPSDGAVDEALPFMLDTAAELFFPEPLEEGAAADSYCGGILSVRSRGQC